MKPRTIPSLATLDKWDIAFIKHFKDTNRLSVGALRAIWAERVGMADNTPDSQVIPHIVEYLANLIDRLNLTPDLFTTLTYLRPDRAWYVGCPDEADDTTRALYVMASWLRHTEVKYLPGYREAIVNEERLHAALDRDDLVYLNETSDR